MATLDFALAVLTRMFAPVLPYIAEELWSWDYAGRAPATLNGAEPGADGALPAGCSVHRAPWPTEREFGAIREPDSAASFATAKACLAAVHRHKTQAGVSVARAISSMQLAAHPGTIRIVEMVTGDVISAVRAASFELEEDDSLGEGQIVVRNAEFAART